MIAIALRRRIAAPLLVTLLACGDDDGGTPGAFALSGPDDAVSVVAGTSATTTVTVARTGSFGGPVTLAAADLPAGVTVSFAPATIPAEATTSTVTIEVDDDATPAGTSFTLRAYAEGLPLRNVAVPVTITPAPGFALSLASAAASVQQGEGTTLTANLARVGGFTGEVQLAVEGLPDGVTAAGVATTGNAATIALAAAEGATAGTSQLTVRATAPGMADRTATATLTVTERPGFTFTLDGPTASVQQGRADVVVATVHRAGGFGGPVAFSVEGLPAHVTASTSTFGDITTIALAAGLDATPATTQLTVRATAAGMPDRTAALALSVTPVPGTLIQAGVPVANLAGAENAELLFRVVVPAGAARIEARLSGGTGDADLYLDEISPPPSPAEALCGSEGPASEEVCGIGTPNPGDWFILVRGHRAFAGVTLTVTVTPGTTAR